MADQIEIEYIQGASLPDAWAEWRDAAGDLVKFASDPYSFTLVLENRKAPGTTVMTKASGFTGYDTKPNLRIHWILSGDLDLLPPGLYDGVVVGTRVSDGLHRKMPVTIRVKRSPGSAVDPGPPSPPN